MSSTGSNSRKSKKGKKCKPLSARLNITVSRQEESASIQTCPYLQQGTKCQKKSKHIYKLCCCCKGKKISEPSSSEKSRVPTIGKGLKMYLERLNEFGVKPPNPCCKHCPCGVVENQSTAHTNANSERRPSCQKLCFIDDPPYRWNKRPQKVSRVPENATCKQCCPCLIQKDTRKDLRLDAWRHLPKIEARSSLRQYPPKGQRWEDVDINSDALCRAINDAYKNQLRCSLPSWVSRS